MIEYMLVIYIVIGFVVLLFCVTRSMLRTIAEAILTVIVGITLTVVIIALWPSIVYYEVFKE